MTQRSRSPSPESSSSTEVNTPIKYCKETTHGQIGEYQALLQAEATEAHRYRENDTWREHHGDGSGQRNHHTACNSMALLEESERHRREYTGLHLSNLKIIKHLGKGAFGKVVLA